MMDADPRTRRNGIVASMLLALSVVTLSGCTTVLAPIAGTPVSQLPKELLGVRRSEFVPVPVVMFTRPVESEYLLGEGDILAVYIDGVMPFTSPTAVPEPPPANFPDIRTQLPPSIGYPIVLQRDGMINLPLLKPFSVDGMTVEEARDRIDQEYRNQEILDQHDSYPVVSLMKGRENNITVIRSNAGETGASDGTAAGYNVKLPFRNSDVLNAMTQTGGLPGHNEKNEVTVFKTSRIPAERRRELMASLMAGDMSCATCMGFNDCQQLPDGWGDDCSSCVDGYSTAADACANFGQGYGVGINPDLALHQSIRDPSGFVIRLPLRTPPGQIPDIRPSDVTLEDGDVVMIESRETEHFYTGGMLEGGQHPLPRDYDLDVLGAMAIAGQGWSSPNRQGGLGQGMIPGLMSANPTQLYVIRELPCGRTFNISVDLLAAVNDSSQNILVQPGDKLILRHKPHEELFNFGMGVFFTYGIRQLFRN